MEQQKIGAEKPRRRLKKIVAFALAGAAAVSGTIWAVNAVKAKNTPQQTTLSREYTVSQGDVTVGTTESGIVALDDVSVAFPVECTVGSILVKSGQAVKKGDALLKVDPGSVSDSTSELRQKLESAKSSLQKAVSDQKTKLDAAKITYESSKYLAASAPVTKELTLAQLQNDVKTAQTALANDRKDLAAYTALQKTWAADDAKLKQLKQWTDDAQASQASYTAQLSDFEDSNSSVLNVYKNLKSTVETDRANYIQAKNADGEVGGKDALGWYDQTETDQEAADAYYQSAASAVLAQETDLKEKVAQYTAETANYTKAYNDFKDTYGDKYKLTGSDLDAKVAALQNSVKTDQYNLERAEKTAEISSANAETTEKNSLNTADSAQDTYDMTVNQLASDVDTAQSSYDELKAQLDAIDGALNGDGTIKAPCDGLVAQISAKEGNSVQANSAMMVLSKTGAVSMTISVSEDDIANVKLGQEATIALTSQENSSIDAVVESITASPARSGSSSVTYAVVVRSGSGLSGLGTIYDGMSGEATILQKRVKDVVYVSNRAVTFRNGVSTVVVKNSDGSDSTRTVKTGFSNGTYVEIASGLRKGETVLAESAVSTA